MSRERARNMPQGETTVITAGGDAVAVGTPHTESLLSYFCRLAGSHAVSTYVLARTLVERQGHGIRRDFEWQHRNLTGRLCRGRCSMRSRECSA